MNGTTQVLSRCNLSLSIVCSFPAFTPLIQYTLGNLVEMYGEALVPLFEPQAHIYYTNRKLSIEDWAERHQVPMDIEAFFSDGVHPSGLTYQLWAEDFVAFLLETDFRLWIWWCHANDHRTPQ